MSGVPKDERCALRTVIDSPGGGEGNGRALAGTGLLRGFPLGVEASDPEILATASAVLVAAALVARYLPARKVAWLDRATVLSRDQRPGRPRPDNHERGE